MTTTDARFGHFGLAGILVAAGALLALILHLAVPYAHVNYRDEDIESQTLDRGEAADLHEAYGMTGASSPGLTLAGAIVMLVAGAGLVILGFTPMGVGLARWTGWTLALVAATGGLMAFMSSMFWVGSGLGLPPQSMVIEDFGNGNIDFAQVFLGGGSLDLGLTGGFTALVELAMQTDSAGTVIIIGPILVAIVSAVAILSALTVCGNVVSLRDGLRERASRHLTNARWALLLLTVALLLPWSIGKATDYDGQGDRDWFVFGAHTAMNTNEIDNAQFDGLSYAINVFIAAGWIGVLLGILGSLGGVLASENAPPEVARLSHATVFGTLFMTGYAAIVYLLAWIYMWRPTSDTEDFQPGYFAVLMLPVLVMWALGQVKQLRSTQARRAIAKEPAARSPVSFD